MRAPLLALAILFACGSVASGDEAEYFAPPMSDAPQDGQWISPFCDAAAVVVGWDASMNRPYDELTRTYALYVWGHATSDYAARVTLIGGGAAYSVDVPRVTVSKDNPMAASAYLVNLPTAVRIRQYFVDGAGVNGATIGDCPSYVKAVFPPAETNDRLATAPVPAKPLQARELQPIAEPSCGVVYRGLEQTKAFEPLVGFFGNRQLTAVVEVFVDSSGRVVNRRIWRSSGVDGIDDAALSAAQWATYKPAEFLCTPVVSSAIISVEYKP